MDDVFVQPVVSGQTLLNGDELARVALEGGGAAFALCGQPLPPGDRCPVTHRQPVALAERS
jgi:hypothetical protein